MYQILTIQRTGTSATYTKPLNYDLENDCSYREGMFAIYKFVFAFFLSDVIVIVLIK